MKKLSSIILGIIIGGVLTYYFCPRQVKENAHTMEVKAPKDTISVAQAKMLSANWEKNNPKEIDSLIDVEGSRKPMRSVWWPLDDINEYLLYAKAKSDSLGYNMTGVRVYLGNYGKNAKPPKRNRNTMFIVPTGSLKTSKASSINIVLPPRGNDIRISPLNEGQGGYGGY